MGDDAGCWGGGSERPRIERSSGVVARGPAGRGAGTCPATVEMADESKNVRLWKGRGRRRRSVWSPRVYCFLIPARCPAAGGTERKENKQRFGNGGVQTGLGRAAGLGTDLSLRGSWSGGRAPPHPGGRRPRGAFPPLRKAKCWQSTGRATGMGRAGAAGTDHIFCFIVPGKEGLGCSVVTAGKRGLF